MATNGDNNVEDAEMADCDDGQKVVTMMDVLQEQQDFEDDANAVLGASDEKNCTYSKGYIKRQAIYACLTCCSEAKDDPSKRAGVCLACSLSCHENHDLIELYTKRNFRCDCGNPKFNSHPCQFTPDKSDLNNENSYNQNFSGLYCNCHRPYPDPESTVEDEEMIQCIICEDWLHASHLDAAVPGNDQYSEMVCKACMDKNEFLHDYCNLAVNVETEDVDIIAANGTDTKLSNGDLETEKFVNGKEDSSEDTTEDPKIDMDVDDALTEIKPAAENEETKEVKESVKPAEEIKTNESLDVTMEAEKTENPSQMSSDVNSDSKDETNTAVTSEDSTKATEETLDGQDSKDEEHATPQELKETPLENAEESQAKTEVVEELKETEDKAKPDISETEEAKDSTDKHTENNEPTEDENQSIELTRNDNEDNTEKLDSNNMESKQEDVSQTTPENDHTETASEEINSSNTPNDIKINDDATKESAETENSDVAKDESSINKTDDAETEQHTNEIMSEINDSVDKVDTRETLKDVNEHSESKIETPNDIEDNTVNKTEEVKETKRKLSTENATDDNSVKKAKLDEESKCTRPKDIKRIHKGATFWPSNFRQKLCTCSECLSMYKDLSVLFLIDPEDTVFAYETLGKERVDGRPTQYEKGLEALSSLDRIQQINALTEYNKMKDKLLDFLKSFKDRKEIVKEEDIKAFFAGMKPKREPDGVYFCR